MAATPTHIPNLFVIGGMRCGSTTIFNQLMQHPDVFFPAIKEPEYFTKQVMQTQLAMNNFRSQEERDIAERSIRNKRFLDIDEYRSIYDQKTNEKYAGDSSHYFYHPKTIPLLKALSPNARIVVSLRDPTERLFSEFMFYVRGGNETRTFSEYLADEVQWDEPSESWEMEKTCRIRKGYYATLLRPWVEAFDSRQLKVILFEDIHKGRATFQELFQWLEIDSGVTFSEMHTERSGRPKSALVASLLNSRGMLKSVARSLIPRMARNRIRDKFYSTMLKREQLEPDDEAALRSIYRKEVEDLQQLIGRDLSTWIHGQNSQALT